MYFKVTISKENANVDGAAGDKNNIHKKYGFSSSFCSIACSPFFCLQQSLQIQ
jgi:hypothetical protein